ncbi:MAG: TetR/AcrR family transcriptional regulator [Rhodospirillales bacterium]|nr:TetR/AcrR family transcriptional regulator [Rhodospirillales bacterium]
MKQTAAAKARIPDGQAKTTKGSARIVQILEVALEVIASEGHAKLTLEGIAKQVGIRKGNLQYYFPSRSHLVRAALSEQIEQHKNSWATTYEKASDNPVKHLRKLIAYELKINSDEIFVAQVRERWSLEARDEGARMLTNQWYDWVTKKYADLIKEIRPELGDKACHQLAIITYSMLVGSTPFFGNNRAAPRWSKGIAKQIEETIVGIVLGDISIDRKVRLEKT